MTGWHLVGLASDTNAAGPPGRPDVHRPTIPANPQSAPERDRESPVRLPMKAPRALMLAASTPD